MFVTSTMSAYAGLSSPECVLRGTAGVRGEGGVVGVSCLYPAHEPYAAFKSSKTE